MGLRYSVAVASPDGRSGKRRRNPTGGGILVAGFVQANYLPYRLKKLWPIHQPAVCSARSTSAEGLYGCLSVAGGGARYGGADHFRYSIRKADRRKDSANGTPFPGGT